MQNRSWIIKKFRIYSVFSILVLFVAFQGPSAWADDEESFSEEQLVESEAPAVEEQPKAIAVDPPKEEVRPPVVENAVSEDPLKENSELSKKATAKKPMAENKKAEIKEAKLVEKSEQKKLSSKLPPKKNVVKETQPAPVKREQASVGGKGGFKILAKSCPMMRSPASEGKSKFTLKPGRKIWAEDAGDNWFKALDREGNPVYFEAKCFEN